MSGPEEQGPPQLVTAVRGAGGRLAIARHLDRLEQAGHDLALTLMHELLAQGAEPGTVQYRHLGQAAGVERLASGMLAACQEAGAEFRGGSAAELAVPCEDLVGFAAGLAEPRYQPGRSQAIRGDVLVGLPTPSLSEGSLDRVEQLRQARGWSLDLPCGTGTLGEALLRPVTSHVATLRGLMGRYRFKAIAALHGGLGDLYQVLPAGRDFRVLEGSWEVPEVFGWLAREGGLSPTELRGEFNRGLGVVLVVSPERLADLLMTVPQARAIGEIA